MERASLPGGSDKMARATFAAIISAARSNCACEGCRILRTVADEIKGEFISAP